MRANEVAEVASFYSLFNLPRAQAVIQVCTNLPCCLRGARGVVRELEHRLGIKSGTATPDGRFAIAEVECLGSCATAPVVQVNRNPYLENVTPELAATLLESPDAARAARRPAPVISHVPDGVEGYLLPRGDEKWLTLEEYRAHGGFKAAPKAGAMTPKDLATLVKDSNLRGRGGAGFVTGLKWTFMPPRDARPRYLAVNADESEPGTFKDRQIMSRNPFLPLEGIMIAAMAMESTAAFIYIRGEYVEEFAAMSAAIRSLYEAENSRRQRARLQPPLRHHHPAGRRRVHLRRGERYAGIDGRAQGTAAQAPALSRAGGIVGPTDHGRQRRDALARAGDRDARRAMVPG